MYDPKHTCGEWVYTRAYEDGSGAIRGNGNKTAVATISATSKTPRDEKEANGQLLAAAPDLLEACRVLCTVGSGDPEYGLSLARRAFQKATGHPPCL